MPESTELFNEIAMLRDQVDDMSRSVAALTRKSGLRDDIVKAMDDDPMLMRVFLLVDGKRTQTEILSELKAAGHPGSPASVSRKIDALVEDWDLIRPTRRSVKGISYVHTSLAKDLGIARALQRKLASPQSKRGK
jgi:hypothetical protein